MVGSNTLPFAASQAPDIDPVETRWAAGELADLLRQVGPDSPAAMVLDNARRELESLIRSADETPRVVGPFRFRAAA